MEMPGRLGFCLACLCTSPVAGIPLAAQDGTIVTRDTVHLSVELTQRARERAAELGVDFDEVIQHVVVQRITYISDGLRVRGYLAEPVVGDVLPAIIWNRGGNREFGAIGDAGATVFLGAFARHGYIVVASQYRGNAGGEGREEFGGAEVNDVLNLIPLLEQYPRVDSARLGMYGWSRGGMMTYLGLRRTSRIRAAVVGAGISDAFDSAARRPDMADSVMAQLIPNMVHASRIVRWLPVQPSGGRIACTREHR